LAEIDPIDPAARVAPTGPHAAAIIQDRRQFRRLYRGDTKAPIAEQRLYAAAAT
jgi:hypothetical protein